MNQCLRCKRPCAGTAVFCDGCQSSLLHRSQQKEYSTEPIFSLPGEAAIPASPPPPEGALSSRMRLAFIIVGIAAAVVLCVDIALVLLSFSQQDHTSRYARCYRPSIPVSILFLTAIRAGIASLRHHDSHGDHGAACKRNRSPGYAAAGDIAIQPYF